MQEFYDISRQAGLTPAWMGRGHYRKPSVEPFLWRWEQAEPLISKSGEMITPDPATGGPVLRTMACWIQLIRPGARTCAHHHTSSAVFHVFQGEGYTVIDDQKVEWREGDFFVVPTWAWHEFANQGSEEAILFSIQDIPVMKSLSLYRDEAYEEHSGHQPVTSTFSC